MRSIGDFSGIIRGRIYYGWFIVAISLLNLMLLYGVWYSFSVFMVVFTSEFGWTRAGASSIFALFTLVIGLTAPLTGLCVDRFGPKRTISVGALILMVGLFLSSRASSMLSFYVSFGVIAGLGGSAIGLVGNSRAVANWFLEKRGLASGIATSGIGLGMLIIVPLAQVYVHANGWRPGFLMLAVCVALLVPLNVFLQKNGPENAIADHRVENGFARGFWGLLREKAFWYIFIVFFTGGFVVQAVVIHQVAIAHDAGFPPNTIEAAVAMLGLFSIFGRVFWGLVSDRIGRANAYLLASLTLVVGLCLILYAADSSRTAAFYGYSIFFGTGYSAIAPLNWSIAADIYSGAKFGAIYGFLFFGTGIGASLGSFWSGIVFDFTSSYFGAFLSVALLLLCSNVLIHRLYVHADQHPYPMRIKEA